MKEGYIIRDQEKIHFINATVVITRKSHKDIKGSYYRVSSANNYVNNEGLIEVKIVDNPV